MKLSEERLEEIRALVALNHKLTTTACIVALEMDVLSIRAQLSESLKNEQASANAYAEVKAELEVVTNERDTERLDFAKLMKEVDGAASRYLEAYHSAQSELAIAREALNAALIKVDGNADEFSSSELYNGLRQIILNGFAGAEPKSRG